MTDALSASIREAFGLVVASVVPLFAIVAAVALVFGLLAGRLGLRDPALAQIVRALAVILAVGFLLGDLADAVVEFAEHSWGALADAQP
jgi:hypothetical protein